MNPPSPPGRGRGMAHWLAALLGGAGAAQGAHAAPAAPAAPASPPPVMSPQPAPAALSAGGATARRLVGQRMLVYKSADSDRLKLHIAWPPNRFAGPRPCVVFFHGGGWRTGSPKQFAGFAEAVADHGVVGISAQYRLMDENDRVPMAAIRDARSAMRYVRAHATELGCDPRRIGAGGGSSGGHLAALAAAVVDPKAPAPAGAIDDAADDLRVSPRPDALFLMNPPLNLEQYNRPVPVDQRRQLSPTLRLDATWPPTWIFHGTADKVVPVSQAQEFKERAREVGAAEVVVKTFQGRGHGFFNAKREGGEDHREVIEGMLAGLKKIGWID